MREVVVEELQKPFFAFSSSGEQIAYLPPNRTDPFLESDAP